MFEIPKSLQQLLAAGRWPRNREEAIRQNLVTLVPVDRIKQLASNENSLYLSAPPFHTVAELAVTNKFWLDPRSAPTEIDFEHCVAIGDFGLGSDAPILLHYRTNQTEPRVLRLQWSETGGDNHWVEAAPTFDEFARILGLLPIS